MSDHFTKLQSKGLKYFESAIVVEKFQIVLHKQNEIFEIRIFTHSLNFSHFYLIHFYSHGITSPFIYLLTLFYIDTKQL